MKKKIEFDANVRTGTKATLYPVCWIPVPDDFYEQIPTHFVDGQCESVKRFHVTLSPVEDQDSVEEPDYEAMCEEIMATIETLMVAAKKARIDVPRVKVKTLEKTVREIEAKHTPQAGVKKEGK